MKNKKQKRTTTIAVSIADNERLTEYCETYKILKKDFISIILNFLENNGINPKTDNAPKTELALIKKRINFHIGFAKTQEKEFIRPAMGAIIKTEERLKDHIENVAIKQDLEPLLTSNQNIRYINKANKIIQNNFEEYMKSYEKRITALFKDLKADIEQVKSKRGIYFKK